MSTFFRWASAVITLGVLLVAVAYFLWLRDFRLSSGPLTDPITAQMTVTGLDSVVTTPIPAPTVQNGESTTTPEPETADIRQITLATQPPRQAVEIVPAASTPTPETIEDEPERDATTTQSAQATDSSAGAADLADLAEAGSAAPMPDQARSQQSTTDSGTPPAEPAPTHSNNESADALQGGASAEDAEDAEDTTWLQPVDQQFPGTLAFGIATPTVRAQIVVPPVVVALPLSELLPTPTPFVASTATPVGVQLYSAPDVAAALAGVSAPRAAMEIVARDTTGRWFLLVDGLWVQATTVENPPALLPFVVPTITPTPTNTGFPTPTDVPEPTPIPPATPTPTPTPLDFPVCDCTPSTYACVAHSFPVRAQAQACFDYCFRQTGRDVHNLDPDGNGLACENLSP